MYILLLRGIDCRIFSIIAKMCICMCILNTVGRCFYILCCMPLFKFLFCKCNQRRRLKCFHFLCGCALGQAYYYYVLKRIPLSHNIEVILSSILRLFLGIMNAISIQIRCISLLLFPMYCGKAGRGVLKVVVLTYVVAGPITNMGKNAREVVRVFSCCTQLSYNLSKDEHRLLSEPFRKTAISLRPEMEEFKETFRSINDIVAPIEHEVENMEEIHMKRAENDILDNMLSAACRSEQFENIYILENGGARSSKTFENKNKFYQGVYEKKLIYRCENQLTRTLALCSEAFEPVYDRCLDSLQQLDAWMICFSLKRQPACNIMHLIRTNDTCFNGIQVQIDPGFGEGYLALKEATDELTKNMDDVKLQYKVTYEQDLYDIQDAKETGERVMHAFEEKTTLMSIVAVVLNLYVAVLILRIQAAAVYYHDKYLTSIEHDNVYITNYFKVLDHRRQEKNQISILPLKKMEKSKYIDVSSLSRKVTANGRLLTQILKLMLEVVTATTFVMLDRLFYEALDVVRQHAQLDIVNHNADDIKIEVEGTGMLATLFRQLLSGFTSKSGTHSVITNQECLPHPRAMATYFYFKIYGGYLWILLLLYIDPYTERLRRLICSYFYPRREKQRILHLYNDILKKRMKMQKTLRRKAVQAVRAHYLSGDTLLSLRMKFPQVVGWLRILPAARMTCLICSETEPRIEKAIYQGWYSCRVSECPFVYCGDCWRETGARCLACDPSLAEFSDIDSLSEDEYPKY